MPFGAAVRGCLSKYRIFTGRASRSEFWWFCLFLWLAEAALLLVVVLLVVGLFLMLRDDQPLFTVILINGLNWLTVSTNVVFVLLLVAVAVRRLHDIGRSGWWLLIAPVPLGVLVLIFWWAQPSAKDVNTYGPLPLPLQG